ncbi:hypothetical protein BJ508DRAFT_307465 [Ascobolus immersus RN42]|uniref:Uncharacterized protein n=1 Tax=Ascobolus immersus RN42 TaxID=1160509 RepID=A0A3N4I4S6_ASCIM|nr:hypothetical protein BJ508DRAFT_307465 [Ascobolus immersus RN42]
MLRLKKLLSSHFKGVRPLGLVGTGMTVESCYELGRRSWSLVFGRDESRMFSVVIGDGTRLAPACIVQYWAFAAGKRNTQRLWNSSRHAGMYDLGGNRRFAANDGTGARYNRFYSRFCDGELGKDQPHRAVKTTSLAEFTDANLADLSYTGIFLLRRCLRGAPNLRLPTVLAKS